MANSGGVTYNDVAKVLLAAILVVFILYTKTDSKWAFIRIWFALLCGVSMAVAFTITRKRLVVRSKHSRKQLIPERPRPEPNCEDLFFLAEKINQYEHELKIGVEKRSSLHCPPGQVKSDVCLVYVHGFKTCPMDLHPLIETVQSKISRNASVAVLKVRLSGHGQTGKELAGATTDDLLEDMKWALEVANTCSRNVVLVGHSLGGAACTWLASHHGIVQGLVLVSPCFQINDYNVQILGAHFWPRWLRRVVLTALGDRCDDFLNEKHAEYWIVDFPVIALDIIFGLLDILRDSDLSGLKHTPILAFHHKQDSTARYQSTEEVIARIREVQLEEHEHWGLDEVCDHVKLVTIHGDGDEDAHHVIAGNAFSPQTTDPIADEIADFVKKHVDFNAINESSPPPKNVDPKKKVKKSWTNMFASSSKKSLTELARASSKLHVGPGSPSDNRSTAPA